MFSLQDSNGFLWSVTVTDAGLLQTVAGPLGSTPNVNLNDNAGGSWLLGVDTSGNLQTTSVTFSSAYPASIVLVSPGSFVWFLRVISGGLLTTTLQAASPPAEGQSSVMVGRIQRRPRSQHIF
jgi:hypothetical protein